MYHPTHTSSRPLHPSPPLLSLSQVTVDGSPLNCSKAIRTMAAQHKYARTRKHTHTHTHSTCYFLHTLITQCTYSPVHFVLVGGCPIYVTPPAVSPPPLSAALRLSSLSLPSHLLCRQEVHSALKEACFLHSLEEAELKGITRPSVVGGRVCGGWVCLWSEGVSVVDECWCVCGGWVECLSCVCVCSGG